MKLMEPDLILDSRLLRYFFIGFFMIENHAKPTKKLSLLEETKRGLLYAIQTLNLQFEKIIMSLSEIVNSRTFTILLIKSVATNVRTVLMDQNSRCRDLTQFRLSRTNKSWFMKYKWMTLFGHQYIACNIWRTVKEKMEHKSLLE